MGAGYLGKKSMSRRADDSFYRCAVWRERFAWTPKRCDLTHKWIWLRKTMMGVAMWTGPGEPVFEFRWHNAKEHIFWRLSNEHI